MRRIRRIIRYFMMLATGVFLLSGFSVAGQGYRMYREAIEATSLEEMVSSVRQKENFTELEDIPVVYQNAVVSVEDHRFYHHIGIDFIAIGRAALHDIQAGSFVEGGSTITQQLAKNLYFTQEKELTRKVAEVFVAFDLEKNYTKDEILELYMNSIYYGDGYYTVSEASQGYFGKEPEEMSEYESTLLAGIPNAPSKYAPTKSQELAEKRQRQVLRRLEACGYFSQEEVETVSAQMMVME